jgi:GT2 family glycosyltransferase
LEILIVDNAPRDTATELVFDDVVGDDPRFQYVVEPRPGLSRARNRALDVARGQIIAFTDDDVRVDPHWIAGVRLGFGRAPDVACVTGLVATASLTTRAERYFDARVWWSSSCVQRLFRESRGPQDPLIHPFAAGLFGTGANMAFRRDVILRLGGFDEAFGAGSPTGGSEDLDAFVRVLRSGYALSYEPSALVWHEHRATDEALTAQMYSYGRGLSAYITKYLTQRDTIGPVLIRAPRAIWHLLALQKRSEAAASEAQLPPGVKSAEMRGFLLGPFAYLKARAQSGKPPLPRLRPDTAP